MGRGVSSRGSSVTGSGRAVEENYCDYLSTARGSSSRGPHAGFVGVSIAALTLFQTADSPRTKVPGTGSRARSDFAHHCSDRALFLFAFASALSDPARYFVLTAGFLLLSVPNDAYPSVTMDM